MAKSRQATSAIFTDVTTENIEEVANLMNEQKYSDVTLNPVGQKPELKQLVDALKDNTHLEKLRFYSFTIDQSNAEALADLIRHKKTPLRELDLTRCNLNAETFAIIAEAILENPKIENLNLDHNDDLFKENIEPLKKLLVKPKLKLLSLNVEGCGIDAKGLGIISDSLIQNQHSILQDLNLSSNELQSGGIFLAKILGSSIPLMRLYLKRCDFNKIDIEIIANALKSNTNLLGIGLDSNASELAEIASSIAAFLGENTTLEDLDLRWPSGGGNNFFTDKEVEKLCKAISANTHSALKNLDLSIHKIGNKGAESLSNLNKLEELALFYCDIGDIGAIALARSNIRKLDLTLNKITQAAIQAFEKGPERFKLEIGLQRDKYGDPGMWLNVQALEEKMIKEKVSQASWKKAGVGIASMRATATNPVRHHIISLFPDIKKADEEAPQKDTYDMRTFKKPTSPAIDKKS